MNNGLFKISVVDPTESSSCAVTTSDIILDIHTVKERLKLEYLPFSGDRAKKKSSLKIDFCSGMKSSSALCVVYVSDLPWLCVICLERTWTSDSALEPWRFWDNV